MKLDGFHIKVSSSPQEPHISLPNLTSIRYDEEIVQLERVRGLLHPPIIPLCASRVSTSFCMQPLINRGSILSCNTEQFSFSSCSITMVGKFLHSLCSFGYFTNGYPLDAYFYNPEFTYRSTRCPILHFVFLIVLHKRGLSIIKWIWISKWRQITNQIASFSSDILWAL